MRLGLSYSFVWLSMPVETGPLSALPIRSGQRDLFEVVGLLLELHGDVLQRRSVFTRESLLARVWGSRYEGGARTVDIHVRRLRAKLGDALPLETLRGAGYKLRAPNEGGKR